MRYAPQVAFILLLLATIAGCRKEKDGTPPTVTILSPTANSSFAYGGEILVEVRVSDDVIVTGLTISVVDVNGVPVLPSRTLSVDQQSFTTAQSILVNNIHLVSGAHTIIARASDGNNSANDQVLVQLVEAPLERTAILSLDVSPPTSTVVHSTLADLSVVAPLLNFVGDLGGAALSSYDQILWMAGGTDGDLMALDANTGALKWSQPNLSTNSTPFFSGLHYSEDDRRVFFAQSDGRIRGLTATGIGGFNADVLLGHLVATMTTNDDYLISEQKEMVGNGHQLVAYHKSSGAIALSYPLDVDVVEMFAASANHLILFGNRNGDGVVLRRTMDTGADQELQLFAQEQIQAAVQVNTSTYVIALPSGIRRFTTGSNAVITFNALNTQALAYDPADGVVFAHSNDHIVMIDPVTGSSGGSIWLPADVTALFVLNNK